MLMLGTSDELRVRRRWLVNSGKVFGMQMRSDANLEKDNTGKETSSANSTTSTIIT